MFLVFVLNRKCTEQTEHDDYVPVFVLNRKCTEQTEHDNYVPGVCFEQDVYATHRS